MAGRVRGFACARQSYGGATRAHRCSGTPGNLIPCRHLGRHSGQAEEGNRYRGGGHAFIHPARCVQDAGQAQWGPTYPTTTWCSGRLGHSQATLTSAFVTLISRRGGAAQLAMRLAGQGMTRCQTQCPKDKSGSTDINILITEPTRTWIIKYDRSQKSKQFAPLPSCPQMNFYKVIYSLSMGTGRLMTLLSFPLPEATNRRPSGI